MHPRGALTGDDMLLGAVRMRARPDIAQDLVAVAAHGDAAHDAADKAVHVPTHGELLHHAADNGAIGEIDGGKHHRRQNQASRSDAKQVEQEVF